MRTFLLLCLIIAALPLVALDVEGEDQRDIIYRADGRPMRAYVENETREHIVYRISDRSSEQTMRYKDLRGVHYYGMDRGYWARAVIARNEAAYDKAGENFKSVFQSAQRSWESVYGLFGLADMLERLGQNKEAAAIFSKLLEDFPDHRLSLNAWYRLGINQALAGDDAGVEATLEELKKISRMIAGSAVSDRMKAVSATQNIKRGRLREAMRDARRLFRRIEDDRFVFGDRDMWMHWTNLWGTALEQAEEWDEAAEHYQDVLERLGGDVARKASIALKLGQIKVKGGQPDAALYDFLMLDVLPIGNARQRATARLAAARILIDQAARQTQELDQQRQIAAARVLLRAVVTAEVDPALGQEAQALLDEIAPEEA